MELLHRDNSPPPRDSWFVYFHLDPMPTPRPRAGRQNVYNKPEYTEYKKQLATQFKLAFQDLWMEATKAFQHDDKGKAEYVKKNKYFLICEFFCTSPRGDADNYLKGVQDAMQDGGIIVDDKQIEAALPWVCPVKRAKGEAGIHIILTRRPSPKTIVDRIKEMVSEITNLV